MKMIVGFAERSSNQAISLSHVVYSIKRNFGGFDPRNFDPMDKFRPFLKEILEATPEYVGNEIPPTDSIDIISSSLAGEFNPWKLGFCLTAYS